MCIRDSFWVARKRASSSCHLIKLSWVIQSSAPLSRNMLLYVILICFLLLLHYLAMLVFGVSSHLPYIDYFAHVGWGCLLCWLRWSPPKAFRAWVSTDNSKLAEVGIIWCCSRLFHSSCPLQVRGGLRGWFMMMVLRCCFRSRKNNIWCQVAIRAQWQVAGNFLDLWFC